MASGIAHRRTKPALYKLNAYDQRTSFHASRWPYFGRSGHARIYDTGKKSRRRFFSEPTGPEILGTVALEIILMILLELDFPSLRNMRQLNSHFQMLVESLPAYRLLEQHASETLRVIQLSGVASAISVKQLFDEFRQPSCRGCGSFGPFLFLPSVSRCCESCLENNVDFQMFPLSMVSTNFAITSSKRRNRLPVVSCPKGAYGHPWDHDWTERPVNLVSFAQVESLGIQIHGSRRKMREAVREQSSKARLRFESRQNNRRKTRSYHAQEPAKPMTLRSDFKISTSRQWNCCGATHLPFWDSKTETTESGVYCSACDFYRCPKRLHGARPRVWNDRSKGNNTAFTLDTIPQHFEECEFIRKGYKFGDRYQFHNSAELGLDFFVNENGVVEKHPAAGKRVPRPYLEPKNIW
ncbi:hypothetical protein FQN54_002537 [Arachnomyces sp. PD_36]|nr:hypothetical protein FQN54_002537 [Arachnomyces sp. PD_36]